MKPVKLKPINLSIQKAFQKKFLPLRLRDFCGGGKIQRVIYLFIYLSINSSAILIRKIHYLNKVVTAVHSFQRDREIAQS